MEDHIHLNDLKRSIERSCLVAPNPNIRERLYTVLDIIRIPHPHNYIALARLDVCLYELSITKSVPYIFVGTDCNDIPLYKYVGRAS
ncbi:MAG: hypothetical protein HWE12_06465 [Oceanospirillaceae bacterium]|nr:hypothetical protein [Oceanospirillaceae bacterium]